MLRAFVFVFALAACASARAETIDLRRQSEANRAEEISFCARPSPNAFGFPGHAFVGFSHTEGAGRAFTALGRSTNAGAAPALRSYFGAPTTGLIAEERYSHIRQDCLTLLVSPADYARARAAARPRLIQLGLDDATTQRLESYALGDNDCLTFIIEVASTLRASGLRVPARQSTDLPLDYIQRLRAANAQ
ncbi:hypothetical protein [Vitreimonas flagellata]|uniref:hypothetical protein n=1 Tax=Vitreimonas flagellata TaxID=2560861 RepID=UPI001074B399|nr:hypothetical protein [Vitreimonas flagellata]